METSLNTWHAHPVSPPPCTQADRVFHFLYKRNESYVLHIMVSIDGLYWFFFSVTSFFLGLYWYISLLRGMKKLPGSYCVSQPEKLFSVFPVCVLV